MKPLRRTDSALRCAMSDSAMESVPVDTFVWGIGADNTCDEAGSSSDTGGEGSGMRSSHLTVLSTAQASWRAGGCGRIDASSARSASILDLVLRSFLARAGADSAGADESLLLLAATNRGGAAESGKDLCNSDKQVSLEAMETSAGVQ